MFIRMIEDLQWYTCYQSMMESTSDVVIKTQHSTAGWENKVSSQAELQQFKQRQQQWTQVTSTAPHTALAEVTQHWTLWVPALEGACALARVQTVALPIAEMLGCHPWKTVIFWVKICILAHFLWTEIRLLQRCRTQHRIHVCMLYTCQLEAVF